MTPATRRRSGLTAATAALLIVTACGGSTSTTAVAQQTTTPLATTTITATTQQQTSTSEIPPEDIPNCEGSVDIPTSVDSFTIALTGLTADLDLFVGYPDLETVKKGGLGLRTSSTNDAADHSVSVDIDPDLIWSPCSYYIEVSAGNLTISSPFTLTVSTP